MIEFFIPIRKIPSATQQTHKITTKRKKSPGIYDTAELKTVRQLFRDHLAKFRPEAPLQGPVMLYTIWSYPASKQHPPDTWKTTKPDTDNLIKLVKDEMTKLGFWRDDAQVCCEVNSKVYAKISGVGFRIRELDKEVSE